MSGYAKIAVVLSLLFAGPAYAFKEVPADGTVQPQGQAAQPTGGSQSTLPFADEGVGAKTEENGVELKIPGIGKVGTLPKLDFGLELLYGAAEQELPENELEKIEPNEDMTIRGTLKHTF